MLDKLYCIFDEVLTYGVAQLQLQHKHGPCQVLPSTAVFKEIE